MRRIVVLGLALLAAAPAGAEGRYAVGGRVVLVGEPPSAEAVDPGTDACCVAAKPVDGRVVVGDAGGLANVVVSVEPRWDEPRPEAASPDPPSDPAVLTNRGCAFSPRVVIVRVGQPLVLENDDPTLHNVDARLTGADRFNLVLEPEGRRELRLTKPQRKPLAVGCSVHTFMRGWLFVRDNPYAAVTDRSGRFVIEGLPPGEWRLRFWHEGEHLADLPVGERRTDERGSLMVGVAKDSIDLGEIRLPAEWFER